MLFWVAAFSVHPPTSLKFDLQGEGSRKSPPKELQSETKSCFAALCLTCHGHFSLSGKFREKASILHKIAKKKCQVEDSEKANGVASRSGKKLLKKVAWKPRSLFDGAF